MEGLGGEREGGAEPSTEVERMIGLLMKAIEDDVRRMAESIVLKRDDELLGPGEFDLRGKLLQAACHILEATVEDRKKGGTKAAAQSVPTAAKTPGLSGGGRRP